MNKEKLAEILKKHKAWLNDEEGGERADLRGADLRGANLRSADLSGAALRSADLSGANLSGADLRGANLRSADLSGADLSGADLRGADLRGANLRSADLSCADLRCADLRCADLRSANLRGANLRSADLSCADLSGAKNLISAINYIDAHFERTANGYIAYKTFGGQYAPPEAWKIEKGSVITENVNFDRCQNCGSGINVAPLEWVKEHYNGEVWKVLIRLEWLAGVCVPYMTDGKIRCERVELLEVVKE